MILLQFDGGSRGNPGPSGCGAVLYSDHPAGTQDHPAGMIWKGMKFLGTTTNNVAEYSGLLLGLQHLPPGTNFLRIEGDSNLVVQQVLGNWKVKHPVLQRLHAHVMTELQKISNWSIRYIPRLENAVADQLANDAMNTMSS